GGPAPLRRGPTVRSASCGLPSVVRAALGPHSLERVSARALAASCPGRRHRQLERCQASTTQPRASFPCRPSATRGCLTMAVRAEAALTLPSPPLDERSKYLRRLVVRTLHGGERGHVGSSMSLIEIMRVLYDDVLRYRAREPKWRDRDRMILSKGH